MLTSPKKPVLIQAQPTHVDLFVEYYDLLRRWAFQFTEHDKDLAEDLLHDTFIHFTLTKPDLSSIQNLDGYLFVMMRNLHLSQLRRATRSPIRSFAAIEYDTADMSFWASDPRDHLRMRDELNAVCQFACIRKEGSKTGSILILRFFHGYYPDEIALVMHSTRGAVNAGLKQARAEARLYLEEPERLGLVGEKTPPTSKITINSLGGDLRLALRGQIFDSRQGSCTMRGMLEESYKPERTDGIDRQVLAHIVSCQTCIEIVNSLLGLPPLASRYPLDTIGKDPGKKRGSGGGAGGSGGGPNMLDSYISRREAHYHHEPKELCISVNGQFQGLQKIVSGKGELMLVLDTNESLGFVEVFSELGLRLLMLNIEPPPTGDGKQSAHVELSSGRTIDANLNFSGTFPALQVMYNDPTILTEAVEQNANVTASVGTAGSVEPQISFSKERFKPLTVFDNLRHWLQPARITAAFAVLIVAVFSYLYFMRPVEKPLTASDVLANATGYEAALAANADLAIHRSYKVEEYSNGSLQTRHRVDDWQKVGSSARRVFDEKEKMVAGDWRAKDSRQVFKVGEKLKNVTPSDSASERSISETEPTAAEFASLLKKAGVSSKIALEEAPTVYNLIYKRETDAEPQSTTRLPGELLLASLTLDRANLQPRNETIVLRIGDETREYRFTDIHVEQKPAVDISPLIFIPEAELLQGATKVLKPVEDLPYEAGTDTNMNVAPIAPTAATTAIEVEVLDLLHKVGADISEQLSVTRTADGRLLVEGLVESETRKREILGALSPVANNPAIKIKIQTIEEATRALARQKRQSQPATVDRFEVEKGALPADADLRAFFAGRGGDTDAQIRAYASRVIGHSQAAGLQASALNRMASRFTATQLAELAPADRAKLMSILKGYSAAVRRETAALRSELAPVFGGFDAAGAESVTSDADLIASARRLFELTAANDRSTRTALTFSSGGSAAAVKTAQFRRNVIQAEAIAVAIERAR